MPLAQTRPVLTFPVQTFPANCRQNGLPLPKIVVPTCNERQNQRELVKRLDAAMGETGWEMVVADDDSANGAHARAKGLARRDSRLRCLRRIGRRGLSSACVEGILSSAAPCAAVMDGDLQHDETLLPQMLAALREGRGGLHV